MTQMNLGGSSAISELRWTACFVYDNNHRNFVQFRTRGISSLLIRIFLLFGDRKIESAKSNLIHFKRAQFYSPASNLWTHIRDTFGEVPERMQCLCPRCSYRLSQTVYRRFCPTGRKIIKKTQGTLSCRRVYAPACPMEVFLRLGHKTGALRVNRKA